MKLKERLKNLFREKPFASQEEEIRAEKELDEAWPGYVQDSGNISVSNQKPNTMAKYTLKVKVTKIEDVESSGGSATPGTGCSGSGIFQDSIEVVSSNLTLDEVKLMRDPLLQVLQGWNKEDAE